MSACACACACAAHRSMAQTTHLTPAKHIKPLAQHSHVSGVRRTWSQAVDNVSTWAMTVEISAWTARRSTISCSFSGRRGILCITTKKATGLLRPSIEPAYVCHTRQSTRAKHTHRYTEQQ